MSFAATINPYSLYLDTSGRPLDSGFLYFGQAFQDPEQFPIPVFWDENGTIPAQQPIRTVSGYPVRNGSPSVVYAAAQYSLRVLDKDRRQVFYKQNVVAADLSGGGYEVRTAAAGQTVFNLATFTYEPGANALDVHMNGLLLTSGVDYLETDASTVTLVNPAGLNDQLIFQARNVFNATQAGLVDFQSRTFDGAGAPSQNFTLTSNPGSVNNVWVSVAGAVLRPGVDFTLSGNVVTVTPGPAVGVNNVLIRWGRSLPQDALRAALADTTNPANGAALVGFNATLNYVIGTIGHATRQRSVSPVDHPWLARFDGTTDDSPAIQACIDWIISVGGGTIILPRGIANLGAGLAWAGSNVNIIGQGEGATTLRCSFAAGDILTVGDGTANPNNCGISCLSITSSVAKTSGAAIRFRNGHNLRASRIRLDNNMYWGFQFDGGAQQFLYYLDNFEINSGSIGVIVGNDGTLVQDLWVATGVIANCTNDAILLKHCSGWYFRELDLLACGKGLSTFPDAGKQVVAGWMYMVVADTCNSHGYSIITNGGLVAEITMTAPWGASCGVTDNGHGIFVNPGAGTITGISMTVPRCINNRGAGIRINGGRDITMTNPQCFANSQQGSALHDGISVAAGVEKFSIIGGKSGAGGLFGTNNQRYGINVESGASNNYAIIGVDVLGNVTGGINDGGTGGEKHIYGNVGYRTSQQGSTLISSGTSSVTVNHGLSVTPAQTDFITIPTVNISAVGITNWWVDNVTSTSFRINTNANVTANTFFAWTVRTRGA